jgi:membrane-bound ClpP family serine protease
VCKRGLTSLNDLERGLLEMGRYNLQYLCVSINSPGGSLSAVQHIAFRLQQFSRQHE